MTQMEQWLQKGLAVAAVLLVLASSYAFARITWLFISPASALPPLAAPAVGDMRAVSQGREREAADIRTIKRWALFGDEPRQQARPQQPQEIKAPETKLNLALLGVFVAENAENSSAIVGEARGRGEAKRYGIGDRLPGTATLEGVFPDRILLRRNGRAETLTFSKESMSGISVSGATDDGASDRSTRESVRRPSLDGKLQRGRPVSASSRPAVTALGKAPPDPAQLGVGGNGLAGELQNNPLLSGLQNQTEATIKQLGLTTVDAAEGGGYLITESAPRQLLNMLPVSVGDRILSVNGQSLGDPSQDQALFQQILNQESIQVELQKGDTTLTVDINLSDLMGGRR